MMSMQALTTFFGWTTVINFAFLLFTTVVLVLGRGWIARIHGALFGLEPDELQASYFQYIAQYKIAIIVFSFVPYLALKLMA